ncbi:MAG: hypothetical protein LBI26_03555 [Holosporales bacterium]|jgi:hypothetical protein|nr:hypothetical protein [Holosporales bacterium]
MRHTPLPNFNSIGRRKVYQDFRKNIFLLSILDLVISLSIGVNENTKNT